MIVFAVTLIIMCGLGFRTVSCSSFVSVGDQLQDSPPETVHQFAVDMACHEKYGLAYPLTYVFEIPQGPARLRAFRRYTRGDEWSQVPEKTAGEVFNAIEAVRFDYEGGLAFVSVPFSESSDTVQVVIRDSGDRSIATDYLEIAEYYDNRHVAVTITCDDWQSSSDTHFVRMCGICRERRLWLTVGIISEGMRDDLWYGNTTGPDWSLIQNELNKGFVEPAAHSRTHPHISRDSIDIVGEICGCKQDILDNLSMPELNRNGSIEYVYSWIEPHGWFGKLHPDILGECGYICDRGKLFIQSEFAPWDSINSIYGRIGVTAGMGKDLVTDLEWLNNQFEDVCESGGIYHLYCHALQLDYRPGSYVFRHLDLISNRADVWYVGFGHLYVYHYMKERDVVTHSLVYGN
jgi:hypothetical protein